MAGPRSLAATMAAIHRLDQPLTEAATIWVKHQRCGHNQCAIARAAIADIDDMLTKRYRLMEVRDLEAALHAGTDVKEFTA